jgi:hypothetical protein
VPDDVKLPSTDMPTLEKLPDPLTAPFNVCLIGGVSVRPTQMRESCAAVVQIDAVQTNVHSPTTMFAPEVLVSAAVVSRVSNNRNSLVPNVVSNLRVLWIQRPLVNVSTLIHPHTIATDGPPTVSVLPPMDTLSVVAEPVVIATV